MRRRRRCCAFVVGGRDGAVEVVKPRGRTEEDGGSSWDGWGREGVSVQ